MPIDWKFPRCPKPCTFVFGIFVLSVSSLLCQPFETLLAYRLHYHLPTEYDDPDAAPGDKFAIMQHSVDLTAPYQLSIAGRPSVLVTGLFYHRFQFDALYEGSSVLHEDYNRTTFKIGLKHQWKDARHSTMLIVLPTWGVQDQLFDSRAFQFGFLGVHSYALNDRLTLKLGLYHNQELFGSFWMPLAGVDWRLSNDWYIFGLLPGTFNVYKQVNDWFAISFSERAPIGSLLRLSDAENYVRFGRGPYFLLMFDLHFTPVKFGFMKNDADLTLTLSAGHSFFRTYELYEESGKDDTQIEEGPFYETGSGPYLKFGMSMRVWP